MGIPLLSAIADSANYTFSYLAVPYFLVGCLIVGLGLFALFWEGLSPIALSFFLLTIVFGGWQLGTSWMLVSNNPGSALFWMLLCLFFVNFIPVVIFLFMVVVTQQYYHFRPWIVTISLVSLPLAWIMVCTPWLVLGTNHYSWGYYAKFGPWMRIYVSYFGLLITLCLGILWREQHRAIQEKKKRRLHILFIAFIISYVGSYDFLPGFGVPVYPLGWLPPLIFLITCFYTILRYRLVDVTPSFAVEQIISTMVEALLVVDREGVIRVANASAETLFNQTPGSLTGLPLVQASHGLFSLEQMESIIPLGNFRDHEFGFQDHFLNVSASVVLDKNRQPAAFVLLLKDVSERKYMEAMVRQSEKMSAVGQLAAGVAHEINNPLGVILGFAEGALVRIPPGNPLETAVKSIVREAVRCRNLVRDLLVFSRVSKTELEPMDLNQMLEAAIHLIQAKARLINADIQKSLQPELPHILGNPNQIQQVIINLATNALDAMPTGGVLSIKTELLQENPLSWVCLKVTDTGGGIPPEILSKIFDPFFTTKPVGQGTGLGLSLIHEIVEKHSGTIEVQSVPGHTEFCVKFPIRAVSESHV
ncbi:MAG: ATP-binding protein [Elusimicrobiota bacterium]|jgi:PAS domain S-box-containing protein